MGKYDNNTAIEVHNMVLKCKEKHEEIKETIKTKLDEVEAIEKEINNLMTYLQKKEDEYVELMSALMEKKNVRKESNTAI